MTCERAADPTEQKTDSEADVYAHYEQDAVVSLGYKTHL
jgi:hypothetical protein